MSVIFQEKNPGEFRALLQKFQKLNPKGLTQSLGQVALKLVVEGFEQERDPYGRQWKKPIARDGQALSDTGRLRNAFRVTSTPTRVRISNATRYAAIHQFGGVIEPRRAKALRFKLSERWVTVKRVRIPPRPMLPVEERGLGPHWEKALRDEVEAFLREVLQ